MQLLAILAVPCSLFLVPGSGSQFGSTFLVDGTGFLVRRTNNLEPRIPDVRIALRTGTWNQNPGTRNVSSAALPDRDTFLREAREALARSQQVWHQYAYKERRTDVHMNPFGRMGTGDTRVLEVRPSLNSQLTYQIGRAHV